MKKRVFLAYLLLVLLVFSTPFKVLAEERSELNKTIVVNKRQKYKSLALARNPLCSFVTCEGTCFEAKIVEDLYVGKCNAVPQGSVLRGEVSKIDKARRFPSRDGAVHVAMNELQLPNGQIINLKARKIEGIALSPYRKGYKEKFIERTPVAVAYYAISIPIGAATDIAGGAVYAIATGGAMLAGAITGFIDPDVGRSRSKTALYRAWDGTPIGTGRMIVTKGKTVDLKEGDGIIMRFEDQTLRKILESQGYTCRVE